MYYYKKGNQLKNQNIDYNFNHRLDIIIIKKQLLSNIYQDNLQHKYYYKELNYCYMLCNSLHFQYIIYKKFNCKANIIHSVKSIKQDNYLKYISYYKGVNQGHMINNNQQKLHMRHNNQLNNLNNLSNHLFPFNIMMKYIS